MILAEYIYIYILFFSSDAAALHIFYVVHDCETLFILVPEVLFTQATLNQGLKSFT